ncbi:chorismate-binding protein [Tamlana sp. 2201CG12-4]|uniref:chorismate-binding protein n=1 Tax=Tamlana sp. 2201CG12-4 TaxID=3112582 RepID=UPI002DB82C55|nr:chorismate-binding protein [Tamlana sp. 2201CG12-4]MEC3908754.1 chorismate-binding protein [Tamlana sp. 2201CG12-4]
MTSEDFFEFVTIHYNKHLPFVTYRKPTESKVNGMFQDTDELFFIKDFTERGFVFSPFSHAEKTVLIPEKNSKVLSTVFSPSGTIKTPELSDLSLSDSKAYHINLVKQGVEAIKNSNLKKVVLSRKEAVNLSETDPVAIFKRLLNTYKSAFVYCWYHPKVGLWLGATPETLIKVEGRRFSIMSLAGTQDYKGSLNANWEDKEKQEQQFVTDFIVDNLKPLVEDYEVSGVKTVKAGNLIHLKTIISARLKFDTPLKQVIEALHPTPAVCGLPKTEAKTFILNHENYDREFYTGFLGELNFETVSESRSGRRNIENRAYAMTRKSTQLYVNLRCMQLKDQQAIIYIGGGITQSSVPEKEWQETVSKSLVIKNVL